MTTELTIEERIAESLPENPSTEDIYAACRAEVESRPVTSESLKGMYQCWNDWYNDGEGFPVDAESLTVKEFVTRLPSFVNTDVEVLVSDVCDALEASST